MPVLRNGQLARREQKTDEEWLKTVRVGDTVACKLHPAGPGTEEFRLAHGHECDLTITRINEECGDFDGEYYIEDLEGLFAWITMMDGVNDGSQLRERKVIPDIPINCIEAIVERGPATMDDHVKTTIDTLADQVASCLFEREEPGSVTEQQWKDAKAPILDDLIGVVERRLAEGP